MAPGFVSEGSEDLKPRREDDDWLKAQQAIQASRRWKEEEGKQEGGKSLYDILQQNKTAKQELFEESTKLKNQFKTLDDDEIDFLDSVLESTRRTEEQVKRETGEQLEAFRKQCEAAEKALSEETAATQNITSGQGSWATTARKRRHLIHKDGDETARIRKYTSATTHNKLSAHVRSARSASARENSPATLSENDRATKANLESENFKLQQNSLSSQISPSALGLEAYSSAED